MNLIMFQKESFRNIWRWVTDCSVGNTCWKDKISLRNGRRPNASNAKMPESDICWSWIRVIRSANSYQWFWIHTEIPHTRKCYIRLSISISVSWKYSQILSAWFLLRTNDPLSLPVSMRISLSQMLVITSRGWVTLMFWSFLWIGDFKSHDLWLMISKSYRMSIMNNTNKLWKCSKELEILRLLPVMLFYW